MWPDCPAIKGILEEGEEDMKEAKEPKVLDAGMIADAAGRRALRNRALWHADRLGQSARADRQVGGAGAAFARTKTLTG